MNKTSRLKCGRYELALDRPIIMAIINATPDSFSGDGLLHLTHKALALAEHAVLNGAGILDIGGESSRPGAPVVSVQQELDRVLPLLEILRPLHIPISIDTVKPEVMRAAIQAGASFVNDIKALRAPGALEAVCASDAGICLMHMQGEPRTMQAAPQYADVVNEVTEFLLQQVDAVKSAGVAKERIVIDPGFGFGKTVDHNVALFRALPNLVASGYPVLVGVSRKSMLGHITGRAVGERLSASVTAAVMAAQRGAAILRVHDVAETQDALRVLEAIENP